MAKARIFNVLQVLLYCLGFPLFVVVAALNGLSITEKAPGYTFWPFIGAGVILVLGIVYLVIGLIICRKKSKRTIMTQTIAMSLIGVILTLGVGLVLDKVLPDIYPEGDTFLYKTAKYKWLSQSEIQGDVAKEFVRRNMLNGNLNIAMTEALGDSNAEYIGEYDDTLELYRLDYKYLSANANLTNVNTGLAYDMLYDYKEDHEDDDVILSDAEYLDAMLAEKLDREQMALVTLVAEQYARFDSNIIDKKDYNLKMTALNYLLMTSDVYDKLIVECASNQAVADLIAQNFKSMDKDGYVTFDDCLLPYANSSRQTVGVLVHLVLDDRYTGSEQAIDAGKEPYNLILFNDATGENDSAPVNWTILDMDGGGLNVDLSSATQGSIGALLPLIMGAVDVDSLCAAVNRMVADENVANSPLYLSVLYSSDSLEIVVTPANLSRGVEGYQRTAWLDSNGLLLMLLSIISTRDLMSIFAAVIAVTTYLAGICRIVVADAVKKAGGKKKKGKKNDEADATAGEADAKIVTE